MLRRLGACITAIAIFCLTVMAAKAEASVVHIRTDEKVIALTFDDGPHPRYTERILTVLAKYGVQATFFEVGINVERYPDAARAVAEAGHEIGNHTYHHAHLTKLPNRTFHEEVETCSDIILRVTGKRPTLFRPPEGVRGDKRFDMLTEMGYKQILWNLDTLDWKGASARAIVGHVMKEVGGGDILLFHDYVAHDLTADAALDMLIPALQERGYRFITVSELLDCGEIIEPHF